MRLKNQAVMLSRSDVRTDGAALGALDWAVEQGVISVEQHQAVLREVARRTGSLQRLGHRSASYGGSRTHLPVASSGSTSSLASLARVAEQLIDD